MLALHVVVVVPAFVLEIEMRRSLLAATTWSQTTQKLPAPSR